MIPEGLTILPSSFGPEDTIDRLTDAVTAHGMTVIARIDHAAAAARAGLDLRATEVLIFGNAKGGTPLMQAAPTIAIDLPLKTLVWEHEDGRTYLAYNDPSWLAKRHGAGSGADLILANMTEMLAAVARLATTPIAENTP